MTCPAICQWVLTVTARQTYRAGFVPNSPLPAGRGNSLLTAIHPIRETLSKGRQDGNKHFDPIAIPPCGEMATGSTIIKLLILKKTMAIDAYIWTGFIAFVLLMLALDLGVFHRKSHEVKIKEALAWSAVWISLALIFNYGIYHFMGKEKALEFLAGYLIEKSLSVDNLFVFIMLFTFFNVETKYQHKVLFWGILGALILRAIFIFAGVALISNFHWILYIFGAFLVFTGVKMLFHKDEEIEPERNPLVRLFKKLFPVTDTMHGGKFFVKINAKRVATPLFIVLLVVEFTDLIFAVDSIPAILAISDNTFIIFTSNVFAILGLRALYFALAGITKYFHFLKYGLSAILVFVGVKMVIVDLYKIPIVYSLLTILGILAISIVLSMIFPKVEEAVVVSKK
jgi:tellurite resistance protein TerC